MNAKYTTSTRTLVCAASPCLHGSRAIDTGELMVEIGLPQSMFVFDYHRSCAESEFPEIARHEEDEENPMAEVNEQIAHVTE
jgi:hypothetical protein